jgi:hypothetical protein
MGVTDECVLLKQRGVTGIGGCTVGMKRRQSVGHRALGQRLDLLVAVDALFDGLCAGGVHETIGVKPAAVDDAVQFALTHPALDAEQHAAQPCSLRPYLVSLLEDETRLTRRIEGELCQRHDHRACSLGARVGSHQLTTGQLTDIDMPIEDAKQVTMATTILDRLMHRCSMLEFEGRSYRLKEAASRLAINTEPS